MLLCVMCSVTPMKLDECTLYKSAIAEEIDCQQTDNNP